MADQLTSVGVEFSKPEMQRIFYDVNPAAQARPWAMGKIHNPSGVTTIPDRLFDSLPWRLVAGARTPSRKPGLYTGDGDNDPLLDTMESVHPSVRIRYLYDGKGLDDEPQWSCCALTENGYTLVKEYMSRVAVRPVRAAEVLEPYYTVGGALVPFFDDIKDAKGHVSVTGPVAFVRTEQPHERDLQDLPEPTAHWVWKRGSRVLPEEQIGMWERLYMKVNDKVVAWQSIAEGRTKKRLVTKEARKKAQMSPLLGRFLDAWRLAGEPLGVEESSAGATGKKKVKPDGFAEEYGYHDVGVWQRADTTPNHSARNGAKNGVAMGVNSGCVVDGVNDARPEEAAG